MSYPKIIFHCLYVIVIGEECTVNRFRDGEKRRNRLFTDGCIIRKINPGVTFMDLFFNLVHRVYFYYDNSDGVLSDELIARKAYDVMNYTEFDAMEFKSLDTGKVTTSPGYCREHGVSRRSYSRKALMYQNYESIQAWYEPGEICYLKPEGSARQRAYRQSVYTPTLLQVQQYTCQSGTFATYRSGITRLSRYDLTYRQHGHRHQRCHSRPYTSTARTTAFQLKGWQLNLAQLLT